MNDLFRVDHASIAMEEMDFIRLVSGQCFSSHDGMRATMLCARHLLKTGVQGCFVECGVAYGAQTAIMARACQLAGERRQLHLFDSFQGIPLAGPNDPGQPGKSEFIKDRSLPIRERLVSSGVSAATRVNVESYLKAWGVDTLDYVFHEGWFQDTIPNLEMPEIAFLRLDGDLYESTMPCLQWLYPRLVTGGICLVDDYDATQTVSGVQKAVKDYFGEQLPEMASNIDYGAVYWVKK